MRITVYILKLCTPTSCSLIVWIATPCPQIAVPFFSLLPSLRYISRLIMRYFSGTLTCIENDVNRDPAADSSGFHRKSNPLLLSRSEALSQWHFWVALTKCFSYDPACVTVATVIARSRRYYTSCPSTPFDPFWMTLNVPFCFDGDV